MSWFSFRLAYFSGKDSLEKKKWDQAEKQLEKAVAISPFHPDATLALAQVKWKLEKKEAALQLVNTFLEKEPAFSQAHHLIGTFWAEEKEDEKACAALEKAVDCDSKNVEAWYALGKLLAKLREEQKAIHAFHLVTQVDPFITSSRLAFIKEKIGASRKV